MVAQVDLSPYGEHVPDAFVRAAMAITRQLPANWLGLRIAMPFRRLAINRLGDRPVDTTAWGAQVRLYPSRSSCEKVALFTPQLFDVTERDVLAAAVDECVAAGKIFTFIDVGASIGLYSLFVADRGGPFARVLAIEPQPGIVDRLMFNMKLNPRFNAAVFPFAVADRDGDAQLVIDPRDSGGTHLDLGTHASGVLETVNVPCRPLSAILTQAGVSSIDAIKLDIEGAEHLALGPLLREGPDTLLPRLVLIEDRPGDWPVDLYALLKDRGYVERARTRSNVIFQRKRSPFEQHGHHSQSSDADVIQ